MGACGTTENKTAEGVAIAVEDKCSPQPGNLSPVSPTSQFIVDPKSVPIGPAENTRAQQMVTSEEEVFRVSIACECKAAVLSIEVTEGTKVFELRQTVGAVLNLDPKGFALYSSAIELSSHSATLKDYQIKRDSVIKMKKLVRSDMPYADPADVIPSMLLMRSALRWEKDDPAASRLQNSICDPEAKVSLQQTNIIRKNRSRRPRWTL